MSENTIKSIGWWVQTTEPPAFDPTAIASLSQRFREPIHIVQHPEGAFGLASAGQIHSHNPPANAYPVIASLPAMFPEWLGDRSFLEVHGARFPYVAGAMARGIASPAMVIAMAKANMMGFYGTAGLPIKTIETGLDEIVAALGTECPRWGANLIHSPNEPTLENAIVDLYLQRQVTRVSAAAFMVLTPAIVRYACHGLSVTPNGNIQRKNYVFAKISRPEVAHHFLSPAPAKILSELVRTGKLSEEEARLASSIPLSEDITVESDSGGHTDNRPLSSLFATIRARRDLLAAQFNYASNIRLGAAGGLGSPEAVAAAFALGASYVLVGSAHQATLESGLSDEGKQMLAVADIADITMAPSADMFELGVKVQVLKRGTLFSSRASQLYQIYQSCQGLDDIPAQQKAQLEKTVFQAPLATIWQQTRDFFLKSDPAEVTRAEQNEKHRMALVFRWYLGKASQWPIQGESGRRMDYQIWCGPAMGAFNTWVAGSFLEPLANRSVEQVALNLLEGAAAITRAQQLRSYGVSMPAAAFSFRPRQLK